MARRTGKGGTAEISGRTRDGGGGIGCLRTKPAASGRRWSGRADRMTTVEPRRGVVTGIETCETISLPGSLVLGIYVPWGGDGKGEDHRGHIGRSVGEFGMTLYPLPVVSLTAI